MGLLTRVLDTKPQASYSDSHDFWYTDLGTISKAGTVVSHESAMKVSAVYACVKVLAETVASLPLFIYRRRADGGKNRDIKHPLHKRLHYLPNKWQTTYEWREMMMGHVLLRGNAYSEKVRGMDGPATQLIPKNPDRIKVKQLPGGKLRYIETEANGRERIIPGDKMFHLRGLSSDGIVGLSPIGLMRESVGVAIATESYASRFFSQNAQPRGALETDATMSEEAEKRLMSGWKKAYGGLDQSHGTAVLQQGLKWHQISITNEDSQFLETRKFQVNDIARWFRIPPHMIADLEKATYCLPAEVEVLTSQGPRKIVDVRVGDLVWSRNNGEWVLSEVKKSAKTGYDEILTIRTTNRTLRLNSKHRVLARVKIPDPVPGAGGYQCIKWKTMWVPAGELKEGETIVAAETVKCLGKRSCRTRKTSIGFMEFCGLLLGDGGLNRAVDKVTGVRIARADNASYMDHYRQVMRDEFVATRGNGTVYNRKTRPIHIMEQERQTCFASVLAATELKILGLSGNARTKRVPGWVFELDEDLRLAFLRGFLDADGSVDKKGRIAFHSCNETMLSQIRHLCMGLGIPVTNMRCQEGVVTLPNGKEIESVMYTFTCSDPLSNRRIGSHTPEYVERLEAGKPFDRKGRKYPRHGGNGFNEEGCSLSRIVSITKSNIQEAVYDLEVAGTHCFVANGVVVHNSNIEHQSLDFVVHSLMPWLRRWETAIHRDLIEQDKEEYFAEFIVEGLLRGDAKARSEFYASGITNGWINRNEVRAKENMNPEEGLDDFLVPMNMGGAGEETEQQASPAQAALIVEDAAARLVRKEISEISKRTDRFDENPEGLLNSVSKFYNKHAQQVSESLHLPRDIAERFCEKRKAEFVLKGIEIFDKWEADRGYELAALVLGGNCS